MNSCEFSLRLFASGRKWRTTGAGIVVSRCLFRPWLFQLGRPSYAHELLGKTYVSGLTVSQAIAYLEKASVER